jgi:hypothetical protein
MAKQFWRCAVCVLLCGLCLPTLYAQDNTPTPQGEGVQDGILTDGQINDQNPRQTYFFVGTRGEVVRLRLAVTRGDLDPMLLVFDSLGNPIVMRDDDANDDTLEVRLTVANDGQFYVIVTRFGYGVGATQGNFELTLERVGVVSQQGSTLLYGVPVTDTISNTQPQVYYTFRAEEGEILTIEMQRVSGTLDPYLQVLDSDRYVVADNDDVIEGGSHNARVDNFLVQKTGVYIVVASRYGETAGDTVGNFLLSVYEGKFSGIGNSNLAPAEIQFNQPIEGDLNAEQYQRFYRFNAKQDDIISVSLNRVNGNLDTYLILADANLNTLAEDDDSGGGKNALIADFRIPSDGQYVIIALRFGADQADTQGAYRLQIQYKGNAFEAVEPTIPRLLYGTTVPDFFSDDDPDSLYVFWGQKGDIITLTMNRSDGTLDPVLELWDTQQVRMVRDDDSGGNSNALIERYTLPYTGVYYISAQRYRGDSGTNDTVGNALTVLVKVGEATP